VTREAVAELEEMVTSLKLDLLRHHPDQLQLPLDLPDALEGEQKASHQDDVALVDVLGS
jgi:hypothetical protein